jgi:hypothetical protein
MEKKRRDEMRKLKSSNTDAECLDYSKATELMQNA